MLRILCFHFALVCAEGTVVGVLSGHSPTAWRNSSCKDGEIGVVMCNLQVYEAAAAAAAAKGVELLVYPEGYGLSGSPSKKSFYEPQVAKVGDTPCVEADAGVAPQQKALSCMAKKHGLAIATNLFTELANHSRRITEMVFDVHGAVVAVRDKVHLFPSEAAFFEAGSMKATTFDLLGHRWGVLICYEGVYAFLVRDFSQLQAMVDQGATAFMWSIGGFVPPATSSKMIAKKFGVSVVAAEDKSPLSRAGAIVDSQGSEPIYTRTSVDLSSIGYTAEVVVTSAELPAPAAAAPPADLIV